MKGRFCVYTVLLGGHELLNEQPVAKDSSIDFICFTDNKKITSKSWKLIYIEPVFPLDLARSSRFPKICPHRFLPEYSTSLYIDNSLVLKKTPEVILHELMGDKNVDFVCVKHSYRETVLDEFIEVTRLQLDTLNTIMEQLNAYHLSDPEVLSEKPLKGAFLLRNHNNAAVVDAMEEWMAHVLRYSRRDQLSLNFILRRKKVQMNKLDFDFLNSDYFTWPVVAGRDQERYMHSGMVSTLLINKAAQKDQTIEALIGEMTKKEEALEVLALELKRIKETRSWRLMQPLRKIWSWIRYGRIL